ncbi:MAG: DUF4163 domain-containing protein [Desulfitobacteriaceae bacterium]|nr:DUF4163 domain-containing protein [Desulfitobacteriaceae bacterium]MDD4346714.1 DUF4163 domain-containing protein [Desulfitobacteriaceae bacterium]MDD4402279.1 DUF4163 domain-containing protein [Desulfitobacteriaceae bacterium]
MKKLLTWTIAGLLVLVLSACSANKTNTANVTVPAEKPVSNTPSPDTDTDLEMNYEIKKELFIQDDVRVEYPVIINLKDDAKEKNINELIKDEALETYLKTIRGLESGQKYTAEGSCEIKLKSDRILSIAYSSYNNFTPSAHPYYLFYTTNIDLETGKKLALTDFISEIDGDFINALRQAEYAGKHDQEYAQDIKNNTFDSYASDEDLIDALSQGAANNVFFYVTDKILGISMPVAHVAGDHAEFEIPLSKIKQ